MVTVLEALERLQEGNHRFASGQQQFEELMSQQRRDELVQGQHPFAVIVGCSDSRVPVEIVFDQGLGDLFVIRVAGNVIAASQIGSVEFAVESFGVQLVVILGHTHCGAVEATLDQLAKPVENQSKNLLSIVNRIRPSVEGLLATELKNDRFRLTQHAVRSNVRMAANTLRNGSQIIEQLIQKDKLLVVGAEYSLEEGTVDFFDGVPI